MERPGFMGLSHLSGIIMAAKTLKLSIGGQEIAATLESKISKDNLYGHVDHIVEQGGKRLERG